jgi:hypothetical protein
MIKGFLVIVRYTLIEALGRASAVSEEDEELDENEDEDEGWGDEEETEE